MYWLGVLAAVLVAHRGLAGVVAPFGGGFVWLYDVGFLLLSIPAIAFVAVRLYATLGPGADLLADRIAGNEVDTEGDSPTSPSDTASSSEWTDREGSEK